MTFGITSAIAPGSSNGQLLFWNASTGQWTNAAPSVSGGITYTASAGGGTWGYNAEGNYVPVTGTTQAMVQDTRYGAQNASTQIAFSLPGTATVGSLLTIYGQAAAGWKITQASGQSIVTPMGTTTVGASGSLADGSLNGFSQIILECSVSNTTWNLINFSGTLSGV